MIVRSRRYRAATTTLGIVVQTGVAATKFHAFLCFNHRNTETQKKHLFCVSVFLWFTKNLFAARRYQEVVVQTPALQQFKQRWA
jgi:hypothetical protein